MTVLLAYASPPELAIVLALVAVSLGLLAVALRPSPSSTTITVTPRPDRDPTPNFRTLGPRPYDWQRDEPREITVDDVARLYDVPVDLLATRR